MIEHDSGEGRLVSLAADSTVYSVDFALDVDAVVTGESETFSPPRTGRRYFLKVTNRAKEAMPDGDYALKTSNEILRVRKTGQEWKVVTS